MTMCDNCQKNPATVLVESISGGMKYERRLCQSCALSLQGGISFETFLKSFLENITAGYPPFMEKTRETAVTCDQCGMSYDEFKETGRLGCSACYGAFRRQLALLLKNIQGANAHEGKIPGKSGIELLYKREISILKKKLHEAVSEEKYEDAAEYRDAIAKLNAEVESSGKGGC